MLKFFPRTFRSGLFTGAALAVLVAAAAITYERYDTQTLKRTINRGELLCGVSTGLPGFSMPDIKGNWSGFDVDICRAIAAAIFNDPKKVRFVPLDANERFTELQKRKVDVLSRNSTWSMSRETNYALNFAAVSYYDGQGFMLRKSRNIDSGLELDGSSVCVQESTTTQLNLSDYFRANNIKYQEIKFRRADDIVRAYESGGCDVIPADVISKEPLAPVVRQKDDDWLLIVKWTVYAMLNAEELGISSKNIDEAMKSKKPEVMRLVGTEGSYGEQLGLAKDWAARIIRHVGNYGEVYDRNLGTGSTLGHPRRIKPSWRPR